MADHPTLPEERVPSPVEPPAPPLDVAARTPLQLASARLRRDKVAIASAVAILLIIALAVLAPLVTQLTGHPVDQQYRDIGLTSAGIPVPPSADFPLGTDNLGRDNAVRLAYGARISLLVGAVATIAAVGIGTTIGLAAGFMGGWVDRVLSWLIDTTLSLPFLLFAISLVSLVGPGLGVTIVVIVLFTWCPIARVIRGQAIALREREFVEAARSLGASRLRIMATDILPNLSVPIIVYGTLLVPQAIVFEATLSFLGLGVLPPTPTWGTMLADGAALYRVAWWMVLFPAAALLTLTLAFNLLGDALRDAFDPRRTGRGV